MREQTVEGKPCTGRCSSQYTNRPLPPAEDRMWLILCYLKAAALQVAHGVMFEMLQSNANKRICERLPALYQTLINLAGLPACHPAALRQRLDKLAAPPTEATDEESTGSPFFTMVPSA